MGDVEMVNEVANEVLVAGDDGAPLVVLRLRIVRRDGTWALAVEKRSTGGHQVMYLSPVLPALSAFHDALLATGFLPLDAPGML